MTKQRRFEFAWVSGDAKRLQTGTLRWEAIVLGEKLQRKSEIAHYYAGVDSSASPNRQRGLPLVTGAGLAWDGRRSRLSVDFDRWYS